MIIQGGGGGVARGCFGLRAMMSRRTIKRSIYRPDHDISIYLSI